MKTRRLWQHTAHEEALSQLLAPCCCFLFPFRGILSFLG